MKKRVANRSVAVWLTLLMVLTVALAAFGGLTALAAENGTTGAVFVGLSDGMSTKELYDATNTYAYNGDNPCDCIMNDTISPNAEINKAYREYVYYNVSPASRTGETVGDTVQITVLTHGLGGSAAHWSNTNERTYKNGEEISAPFAYDGESLISVLANATDAQVYWAKMDEHNSFHLMNLQNAIYLDENGAYKDPASVETVTEISDVSKHIILVFEATKEATKGYNNYVYEEFNYMLSKIVYDVKTLNGGVLPKINLIGHSRGGITNWQYALDHPEMVDSMFSMGTPYFGSDTASTSFGGDFCKNAKWGRADIIDRNIYMGYYTRWNDKKYLYKDIAVHALGGYSDSDFMFDAVLQRPLLFGKSGLGALGISMLQCFIKANPWLIKFTTDTAKIIDRLASYYRGKNYDEYEFESWVQILSDMTYRDKNSSWFSRLIHNLPFIGCPYFMNDLLVDLPSQLGYEKHSKVKADYDFITYKRKFKEKEYKKRARKLSDTSMPAIVHNLEARDPKLIQYIEKNIRMEGNADATGPITEWLTETLNDGTVSVYGYKGSMERDGVLTVPATIDGCTVSAIGECAFKGITARKDIYKVELPASVVSVGEEAFAECDKLTTVEIAPLQSTAGASITLGEESFAGCTALTEITLQDVQYIDDYAFSGCTALQKATLGANVRGVSGKAFTDCDNLSVIEVDPANTNYKAENGVLFSYDGNRLVAYPQAKAGTEYTVPGGVSFIGAYAFYGNKNLQSVDLHAACRVERYAFYGCDALEQISSFALTLAEKGAFDETAWLSGSEQEDAPAYYTVGKVFVKYNGKEENVTVQGYDSVMADAFAGNENLVSVTLDGVQLYDLGAGAFSACPALQRVTILQTARAVNGDEGLFENVADDFAVYVPRFLVDEYRAKISWQAYADKLRPIATVVSFDTDGGSACDETTAYYGESLGQLPTPQKEHYEFTGWRYGGEEVTANTSWRSTEGNVVFVARWQEIDYLISLRTNGGELVGALDPYYYASQGAILPQAQKAGYSFAGWYDNADCTGDAVTEILPGEGGNRLYYAKWTPNTYNVTLHYAYDDAPQDETVTVVYGENIVLPSPEREGYLFDAWRAENGKSYRTGMPWDIANNTQLVAAWTRKTYYLRVAKGDDGVVWMTGDGFDDIQTSIAYGTKFRSSQELIAAFNPDKVSYKEGYEFDGFWLVQDGKSFDWESMPDIGQDGSIYEIEARYKKETGFKIRFCWDENDSDSFIVNDFGESISLISPPERKGYTFGGWQISDNEYNRAKYENSPDFAIGERFAYSVMPDLSWNKEESDREIWLEAIWEPITVRIVFNSNNGSQIPAMEIPFGYMGQLPTPTKTGYSFKGWQYEPQDGYGYYVQYTDGAGNLTKSWDIAEESVTLYATWSTVRYFIRYELYGGTFIGAYTTTYTINSPTFSLPKKVQHPLLVFLGWNTAPSERPEISEVKKGTTGNLKFYAVYTKIYKLGYALEDGIVRYSILLLPGNEIYLDKYDKVGYTAVWTGGRTAGSKFVMPAQDVILQVESWAPHKFTIKLYTSETKYTETTVTYDQKCDFGIPARASHRFLGWYDKSGHNDRDFKPKQTQYTDEKGELLQVWQRDCAVDMIAEFLPFTESVGTYCREEKHKITDSGRFYQYCDVMTLSFDKVGGHSFADLYDMGYRYVTLHVKMNVSEKDNGHQYVFLYDGDGKKANCLASYDFCHSDGKDTTMYPHDFDLTFDLTTDTPTTLYIRFGASGKYDDDWYTHDINVEAEILLR